MFFLYYRRFPPYVPGFLHIRDLVRTHYLGRGGHGQRLRVLLDFALLRLWLLGVLRLPLALLPLLLGLGHGTELLIGGQLQEESLHVNQVAHRGVLALRAFHSYTYECMGYLPSCLFRVSSMFTAPSLLIWLVTTPVCM